MNTLADDREEVDTPQLKSWVARKRRQAGINPNEPATWFADRVAGDDRHMVTLGRSPGDVLSEAKAHAGWGSVPRGIGRWLVDNRAGEEDADSTYLVVYPRFDPEGVPEEEVN